jgi:PAS domain S-box-containing protein
MVATGVLISLVTEALHRSRAQVAEAAAELTAALEEDMAAHRALGESELSRARLDALYRGLMDTTSAGCFITDLEGTILVVNDAYCRRSGYSREELLGLKVPDLAAGKAPEEIRANLDRTRTQGECRFESLHRAKDGSRWPVEVVLSFSPMDGGRFFAFCQDITERIRAMEALTSLEQFNRAILDSVNANLAVLDPRGVILAVNEPWRRFARENSQVQGAEAPKTGVGDNYLDICRKGLGEPGAREAYLGIQAVLEGRAAHFYLDYACDSPERKRWFSMHVTPMGTAAGGVVITHLDETDRRATELALLESEQRFHDITRASSDWFWELDREGRYTYVSESVSTVLGLAPEAMIGRSVLEFFPPEDRPGMEVRYANLFREGCAFRNLPTTLACLDGTRRHILTSGTPILDLEGGLAGFRGLDRDVTEIRQAEEVHRRLESELIQAQKLESIGRLAGGVAHDFNNMLGVILGQAEVAMMMPGSKPFDPFLTEIRKAAQRSGELTRQLLAFARKQTITPKVLDLNETVQGMLKMLGRLIGEDITLAWVRREGLWKIRMDPSQIDQILANLAVNARDAIAGVGRVTIGMENLTVTEAFLREHPAAVEGDFLVLSVRDSGCGMEPDILNQIFEPFFTTKGSGKGTGLGLATVFGIVKQNDGFILVQSDVGKGTEFRIFLPRFTGAGAETADAQAPPDVPQGHGETILLVEDDAAVLAATRILLEQLGYAVVPARGPQEALVYAQSYQGAFQLLLTDVVMPDMNGRELAERVMALRPRLPVLFMSGYTADILDPHGVLDQGVNFIQKPASLVELARGVDLVLSGAKV